MWYKVLISNEEGVPTMSKTYTAYAVYENGDKDEYTGLTRTRALWRFHWFKRLSGRLGLKSWGWRLEA